MKTIYLILSIFLIVNSQASTYKNINLLDYAELVSHTNKVQIFINEDIFNENVSFFVQKDISPNILLETFKYSLENKGLQLQKKGDIYYVIKQQEEKQQKPNFLANLPQIQTTIPIVKNGKEVDYSKLNNEEYKKELLKRSSFFYDLKHLNYKDIDRMLKLHKDILYTYLPDSNSIVYFASDEEKTHIENLIKKYDLPKLQKTIRLTVFTTRLDKLKAIGSDLSNIGFDLQNFTRLFGSFGSLRLDSSSENKANLYSTISFLQQNGVTEINQSPSLLLRNGEKAIFNSVKNIPYLIQKKQVIDNQTSTQDTYEYKDIGLKISMLPRLYENKLLVDFHLFIEDILTNDITPITSKIELKNTFELNYGDVILISGLNRSEHIKNQKKIPMLGDIPYLGRLFKFDDFKNTNEMTSIIIEVLK